MHTESQVALHSHIAAILLASTLGPEVQLAATAPVAYQGELVVAVKLARQIVAEVIRSGARPTQADR